MKVDYVTLSGLLSTAYLDDDEGGGVRTAQDKYSDKAIRISWDGDVWRQVTPEDRQ